MIDTSKDDISTVSLMEVRDVSERKRGYAMAGGLFGAAYLAANNLLPGVPEVLMGAVLGLGVLFFVLALLPEKTTRKLRKWKRRGE